MGHTCLKSQLRSFLNTRNNKQNVVFQLSFTTVHLIGNRICHVAAPALDSTEFIWRCTCIRPPFYSGGIFFLGKRLAVIDSAAQVTEIARKCPNHSRRYLWSELLLRQEFTNVKIFFFCFVIYCLPNRCLLRHWVYRNDIIVKPGQEISESRPILH